MRRIYFLAFMIIFSIVTISNAQTIEDKDLCVAGNGQENAQACTRYGRILFQDESNPANVDLSMDYFVRSCKLGLLTYCGFAGNLMYYGTKVVKDQVTAFSLLATACDNGKFDYHACYLSGLLALNGEAVEKNTETGLYLLDKGCRNGDEFACDKLVRTYNFGDEGIAEQNLALTVDYAHNGCVYNAGYSCYIAGYYLMTGAPGINKNVDEAQKHLERGCELNSAESCYNLSTLLTANHEFAEVSEAIKNNYQKACELNLYEGCAGTGCFYSVRL